MSDGDRWSLATSGTLTREPVGSIAVAGEYNIVVDIDRDGLFDPSVDRVDRIGIGFFVANDCNNNGCTSFS